MKITQKLGQPRRRSRGGEEDRGLNRKFKRGVKDKGIGHWVNGVENLIISDRPVLQVIRTIREVINTSRPKKVSRFRAVRIILVNISAR